MKTLRTIFKLFIILLVFGCKSNQKSEFNTKNIPEEKAIVTNTDNQENLSLDSIFKIDNDSVLIAKIIEYKTNEIIKELEPELEPGEDYFKYQSISGGEIIYSTDSILKSINIFGQYSGATYNPYAEHYILIKNRILNYGSGKVLKLIYISKKNYHILINNYSRMGDDISNYNLIFSQDTITLRKELNQNKNYNLIVNKKETEEKQSTETIFDLIINKKESPKNFPDSIAYKFDFSKRFTEKEISVLNLDTTKVDLSEYYFLTNQKFLKKQIDLISFTIYYRHQYGDQLEKILKIKKQNSNFDLILAMKGGDSFSHSISTEFINDSTFLSTYTHKVGDIIYSNNNGQESTYEYYCDSIISKYKYDNSLNLNLSRIDTLQFSKQIFYRDNKILWSNLKAYSKPFSFQGKECVWEYVIPNYDNSNGISYSQNLLENTSKKVILNGQTGSENYTETINNLYNVNNLNAEIKDINLDGFDDISFYNRVESGTAGEFTDVYIFNKITGTYEYSDLFSGYNLLVNKADSKTSYSARGGGGIYFLRDIYFDKNSKIIYIKKFSSDYIKIDDDYKRIFSYEKIIGNNIVEKVKDTIKNPELEFWEWKKKYE